MSFDKIIEGIVALIFLVVLAPILISILHSISPEKSGEVVDTSAIEKAKNLSAQLELCQQKYDELNETILTKQDLTGIQSALSGINQNVVNIYESNNNYIKNYFSFTIALSLSLGFTLSIGLFALIDLTVFNVALSKGIIRAVKNRFRRESNEEVVLPK